jgi:hypothetical protein
MPSWADAGRELRSRKDMAAMDLPRFFKWCYLETERRKLRAGNGGDAARRARAGRMTDCRSSVRSIP